MSEQKIAISMGDYNGIGPEVVLKSLSDSRVDPESLVLIGHQKIFEYWQSRLQLNLPPFTTISGSRSNSPSGFIQVVNATEIPDKLPSPGQIDAEAGRASMIAVEKGVQLCMQGFVSALVTAPISKEAIHLAGYNWPGHTEFLAHLTGESSPLMVMVHDKLRIALVTSHIPLSQVASGITLDRVIDTIHRFNQSLHNDFSIDEPRIALLGLNPHAGDGGVLGQEENLVIQPAIDSTRAKGIHVSGPFAADALFGNRKEREFDGILAMYHDQGLIPFKTLSFGSGVNYTAGLPIIRTSPDHGTAFDIAGQGTALESSFTSALELAWKLVKSRRELL